MGRFFEARKATIFARNKAFLRLYPGLSRDHGGSQGRWGRPR